MVTDQLLTFPEEKKFVTQQLLKGQYVDSIQSFLFSMLSIEIDLISLELITENTFHHTDIQQKFRQNPLVIEAIHKERKRMERAKEEYAVLPLNDSFYLLLNIENYQTFLIMEKEENFLTKEKWLIGELQPILHELFTTTNNYSEVAFNSNSPFYTPFEKSVFLKEVDLAEKYQLFIAHYLHDEILQSILSIRQSAYQKNDPEIVRHSIEETITLIETSIRKKMLEWEPSTIPEQSLKDSVGRLTQNLVARYDKAIFVQINIPNSLELPISFQQFIYRAIRELLINVYKHSKATKAIVSFYTKDSSIFLLVEDNGKGFKNSKNLISSDTSHFGLYSMYQQVHGLNGTMLLDKSEMGGAKIVLSFSSQSIMKGVS